jgi:hypothetical protein
MSWPPHRWKHRQNSGGRRAQARSIRCLDWLGRRVESNQVKRLREARPQRTADGYQVIPGGPTPPNGVRMLDWPMRFEEFARALTSHPAPLSGRIRKKIKRKR